MLESITIVITVITTWKDKCNYIVTGKIPNRDIIEVAATGNVDNERNVFICSAICNLFVTALPKDVVFDGRAKHFVRV